MGSNQAKISGPGTQQELTEDQRLSSKFRKMLKAAAGDLIAYRHIILINGPDQVAPAEYHYTWSESLLNSKDNEAFEGFRESGKTQYALRAFLLYCLQFPDPSRDYIVLIKKNTRLAQDKLREISQEYDSNPAIKANMIKINQASGNVFSVDCKDQRGRAHNVRIETYGKGASIRGLANVDRRPKIVIIDDPQDLEDAASPAIQARDWEWFLSDVMFLGQSCRIFVIGNNLGEQCILERIEAHSAELGFKFSRIPVLIDGKPGWPGKWTLRAIEEERSSYERLGKIDVWLRERMCLAIADITRIFRKDNFSYFDLRTVDKILVDSNNFMTIDPAASLKDTSDYRALVCNLVSPENYWFIPEVSYGRFDATKLIDEMFRLAIAWNIREVGIEEGIYKAAIKPFLDKEMRRRNQFFNVIPLKHGGKRKEERIRMLQPRFTTRTIFFPEKAAWLAEMESELLAFTMQGTKGLHDDLIDALAYMEQIARVPYKPSRRNRALPRVAEHEYSIL